MGSPTSSSKSWTVTVAAGNTADAATLLAAASGLSKRKVKEAMSKGAVWLARDHREQRLRRARSVPAAGAVLRLHYAPEILARQPPTPLLLADREAYSVWHKPPGLLSQGNRYGDHCAIERLAAKHLERPVFVVHRLDRETGGLILLAHQQRAAAALGRLLRERRMEKTYLALVCGRPQPPSGEILLSLDGKAAASRYVTVAYYAEGALLRIEIISGRTPQVRRHLTALGHPVVGDPRYGRGNKRPGGMRLVACRLAFRCPLTHKEETFCLPGGLTRSVLFGGTSLTPR